MKLASRLSRVPPARFLSVTLLVGYWLAAHGVADFYPISPLGMFRTSTTTASRLLARPMGGDPAEIAHYVDWHCDAPLDFSHDAHPECGWDGFSAYDDIVADYIRSHATTSGSGAAVEIIRRVFAIPEHRAVAEVTDCPLLSCTARYVGPSSWIPRL